MSATFSSPTLAAKYTLIEEVGHGGTATVYVGRDKTTDAPVAVKIVAKSKLSPKEAQMVRDESSILLRLSHPNLLTFVDNLEDPNYLYIVTEMCDGGELFDRIVERERYTERDAQAVLKALAGALDYCHSKHVVHRDLKPENILLSTKDDDAIIKLADFGYAKEIEGNLESEVGTPAYVAPEILLHKPYGSAVDMWSYGVIAYVLLCGYMPFYSENHNELFKLIMSGEYSFDPRDWDNVSPDAKDLIRKCLVLDPQQRITAADVLKHPWITSELVERDITPAIDYLKRMLARRMVRKTAMTVMMTQRLKSLASKLMAPQ